MRNWDKVQIPISHAHRHATAACLFEMCVGRAKWKCTILTYTEKDGTDRTAHLHSLIKTFGVRLQILQNISTKNKTLIGLYDFAGWDGSLSYAQKTSFLMARLRERERESIEVVKIGIISVYIENARTDCPETLYNSYIFLISAIRSFAFIYTIILRTCAGISLLSYELMHTMKRKRCGQTSVHPRWLIRIVPV